MEEAVKKRAEIHYRKMTEMPVNKLILSLCVPTVISMLITTIYNAADTYFVDLENVPMLKGQLSLFTAPVVILFHSGKEFHRQARIIDFKQLTQQLERLSTVR